MAELIVAMTAWVMMTNPANVDAAIEMQRINGLAPDTCFVYEDGSGQCEGFVFPAYDDFPTSHYTR